MKSPLLVFIHKGWPLFLRYAYYQAIANGFDALIIGDDHVKSIKYALIEPIEQYSLGASQFQAIFKHFGLNKASYELACLGRWFILREFMRKSSLNRPVILLDSDVLVFPGVDTIFDHLKGTLLLDTAWTNCITSPECLDPFCDFLIATYNDSALLEGLARKNAQNGIPHLSDMRLMFELADRAPCIVRPFRGECHLHGFDNNFRDTKGYIAVNGHKRVRMDDGVPFCSRINGTERSFHSLHFQGISKVLMERFHTIGEPHLLNELESLEFWLDQSHVRQAAGFDLVKKSYYELRSSRGTKGHYEAAPD